MEIINSPISVEEAAKYCGISTQQIRALCREGKIKSNRLGRVWLIDPKSLTAIKSKLIHFKFQNITTLMLIKIYLLFIFKIIEFNSIKYFLKY